tara:strand:+ start:939 stop:1097 length:159 start_codon:yes stop_codon:yes gene_type:complete
MSSKFSSPFMAKSPLNRQVPNCIPRGSGKDKLPKAKGDPCWESHVQRGMKNK